jgi:hypothetical protein
MNSEKYKKLVDITQNKPNRLRESYFIRNYIDLYNEIISLTDGLDIPFIQRIWHWVNDYNTYYKCLSCDNRTSFNRNWLDGYRKYCSSKCTQSDVLTKEKRRITNLNKYGFDNAAKSDLVKKRTEITNIERYGYKSSFQNDVVRDKWKKTIKDKFGVDHYFQTDEFKINAKKSFLIKMGVDHPLKSEDIIKKIKQTCLERYGVVTYLNTEHSRSCIKKSCRSSFEEDISKYIESFGFEVIRNSFGIISPLSIDIFIPKVNLAIEFNGLYWHSELYKDKYYHLNKTNQCKELGINLIHIWEDDWINRTDILKSIILNKLGISNTRIYARLCEIKEVSNHDCSIFLNENHIQGYTRYSNSCGLYYMGELVSLMLFGWRNTNSKREYELIRFCNKIGTNVIGGASRLFSYFTSNNLYIESITSYADISLFSGDLYGKLGFKFTKKSEVNYWWVVDGIRRHRFNYNKKKLVKQGYDKTKTEVEIMHENGRFRIFGCGQDKWIWHRN